MISDYPVMVCDACRTACCWLGIFMCEESRAAGTAMVTVGELMAEGNPRESVEYWFKNSNTGQIDQHALARFKEEYSPPTQPDQP